MTRPQNTCVTRTGTHPAPVGQLSRLLCGWRWQVPARRKQAMWHSEMYGYVFGAALVGVTHRIRRDVMLYPGYAPFCGRAPMIMHYGAIPHAPLASLVRSWHRRGVSHARVAWVQAQTTASAARTSTR